LGHAPLSHGRDGVEQRVVNDLKVRQVKFDMFIGISGPAYASTIG
jgi:hypothetical protein